MKFIRLNNCYEILFKFLSLFIYQMKDINYNLFRRDRRIDRECRGSVALHQSKNRPFKDKDVLHPHTVSRSRSHSRSCSGSCSMSLLLGSTVGSTKSDASHKEDNIKIKEEKPDITEHSAMDRNGEKNGYHNKIEVSDLMEISGKFDEPSSFQFGMVNSLLIL